jgi:hypothetical protein
MNATFHDSSNQPRTPASPRNAASLLPPQDAGEPQRHLHRARDFGIGYGNSSGYGSELHYVDGHADPIFRCV